jgi:uncharacterized protein YyaL (SSP411 family)
MQNIAWRSWGDPAFAESKESGKPILLSISAVWCHWCHVMDQRTYADPKVIETINKDFIPIRADADREPDVNTRYNMGGWPSTVFLTAERDVLTGSTYLPPDQMMIVLERVASAYVEQIDDLKAKAKQAREDTEEDFRKANGGTAAAGDVGKMLDVLRSSYDTQEGGFGTNQKFPHASALELLMANYESTGSEGDLKMVVETLDGMIAGEVFDAVEGGMFRYATRRDWTVPHYEKLLSDNARISAVLLDAYRLTGTPEYLQTAQRVFSYLEKTLMDPATGLFHGSQDAGEDYYQADAVARAAMTAPKVDSALYVDSNATLARSYMKLYGIGKDIKARDRALRIVGNLNHLDRTEEGCVPHYIENGEPHGFGILSDAAALVLSNVACAEATGDDTYIRVAQELLETVFSEFGSEAWAFYDVSATRAGDRGLTRYATPMEENAALAVAFVKLADTTEDEAYRLSARRVLDALSSQTENYGIMASSYGFALGMLDAAPVLVTVHAYPGTEEADALIQASLGARSLNCTVRTVPLEQGEPGVTVCLGSTCRISVTDPEEVAQALAELAADRARV